MDRETILAMEPGRKMDAIVAEKVLGWQTLWSNGTQLTKKPNYYHTFLFRPSTYIADAMEVFEHFGWQGRVGYQGTEWFCEIFSSIGENAKVGNVKEMNTASEAICKASLLAIL